MVSSVGIGVLRSKEISSLVVMLFALLMLGFTGCAALPSAGPAPAAPAAATPAGGPTIVAVAAPSPPPVTLPQFLGLDIVLGGVKTVGQNARNRLATRFPVLEPRPPVRSLTDPANSSPNASPAVKAAAEAKAEKDEAPQKAKAIKFLASLGCGECYPDTEKALLAALDDCSEEIRYEAVRGIRKSIGDPCSCCRDNSCCSPKLVKRLYELAYDTDETGCYVESSARIRRNARLAIGACGGFSAEPADSIPSEGPAMVDAEKPAVEEPPAEGPTEVASVQPAMEQATPSVLARSDIDPLGTDDSQDSDVQIADQDSLPKPTANQTR